MKLKFPKGGIMYEPYTQDLAREHYRELLQDRRMSKTHGTHSEKFTQVPQEGIKMTSFSHSRKWSLVFRTLVVGLVGLAFVFFGSANTMLADGPHHSCQGTTGPTGGTQCPTSSLIIGISAILVTAKDCATGLEIPSSLVSFELVFRDGAQAPYSLSSTLSNFDLEKARRIR